MKSNKNMEFKKAIPIVQLTETGKQVAEYWSVKQAAEATGYRYDRILLCVSGKKQTYKGFYWRKKQNESINTLF
jgi:hypothetical protein